MKILIVEDEESIREIEKAYLKRAGYTVLEAEDGEKALSIFKQEKVDLVILDLNLPKLDGIEVCKRIRVTSQVPVIMVTARVEEMDELIGLEIGADDYLKKPFSPSILLARVSSLLRRTAGNVIEIDDMRIDPQKMEVTMKDTVLKLTTTQFNILHLLASNPGRVFERDEILDKAYSDKLSSDILDRTIDAHIKSIRKLVEEDPTNPQRIVTIIGKGYKYANV